ncbi:hypothetical protein ACLOJK_041006 [Asimina triloba]
MDTLVTHQFREGNQAAEFLAKQGKLGSNEVYEDIQQVLRFLKGVIRIDKSQAHSLPRILESLSRPSSLSDNLGVPPKTR